ncbi:ABC transporter substrate-binding protein [Paenibacillus sp. GCM10023252]|uniref:ABC transporter substrate-binding protein n=1 Tax=Paenibacillus sp. GCM10023252 TaxID=3252649 RepID=UPI003615730B
MRKGKKLNMVLAIMLAATMFLSACGNSNNGSNTTNTGTGNEGNTEAANNEASDASKLKPRELSIYFEGPATQKDMKLVEDEINKITKEAINATVKVNHLGWNDYPQKMNLMMASGEPFDLMFTAGWGGFAADVAKGAFHALNGPDSKLLETYGKGITDSIDPLMLTGTAINGVNYAIPTQKEMASQQGFLVQKDIAEKYGINEDTVKTLADLEPFLVKIKQDNPSMIPFNASSNWVSAYPYELVGQNSSQGRLPKDGSTKVVNLFEQPEIKEHFKLMVKWNKLNLFQPDPGTNTDMSTQINNGEVAVVQQQLKPGKAEEFSIGKTEPWIQIALEDAPYIAAGDLNNSMLAISKTSEDPERAMMLLNLMHTDARIVNLLAYGVEGVHYVKVSDNVIKYPDGKTGKDVGYNPGNAWQIGNQFLSYLFEQENPNKWEEFKKFNEAAKPTPIIGFSFNAEPVKNEEAAIAAIWKEYIDGLSGGVLDVDKYLAEFNEKLKKAGSDKVIAEKNRQIEEFLKTQSK